MTPPPSTTEITTCISPLTERALGADLPPFEAVTTHVATVNPRALTCAGAPKGVQQFKCDQITKACHCLSIPTSPPLQTITITTTLPNIQNQIATTTFTPLTTTTAVVTSTVMSCPSTLPSECPSPSQICDTECRPASAFLSDRLNCGSCGNACTSGEQCVNDACTSPVCEGQTCNGQCLPISAIASDPLNCGACGNICFSEQCVNGFCTSPPAVCSGQTCNGQCLPPSALETDPLNCGACGNICASGQCINAACTNAECDGLTCDDFISCGRDGSCLCASVAGGAGFCVNAEAGCDGSDECDENCDCAIGKLCVVGSCCGRGICMGPTDVCQNQGAAKMMFRRGKGGGRTVGGMRWG